MPKIIVTASQWIEVGLRAFAEGGMDALVIEKMAASLQCSKSSFYWYFENRSSFVAGIVQEWTERATHRLISDTTAHSGTPDEQLLALLTRMFASTGNGDFLFHLRRLAHSEPQYAAALEEVEARRIAFVSELLQRKGQTEHAAAEKSWIVYHYYLGWYERHKHTAVSAEDAQRHARMVWQACLQS
ncbi:TetR/AcrR family transcriptional regulator [Paenibacillus chartarius]|uniref:TetR/AcrR family transcriptional regulator n=1 Tax=Paenibacillus chartarius TaxID=747481 RepID=A0ABV6DV25_9BACL